jgi:serine/threonine protein phosphatase PrpC
MPTDDEISRVLAAGGEPEGICRDLIEQANDKGGLDNITAIVVEVGDGASRPTPSNEATDVSV